jgi:hypothetical protein
VATDAKLRSALLAKLGVTPQALSLRVQKKKKLTPMSPELATYLIAHEEGVNIDKYLLGPVVQEVRQLVNLTRAMAAPAASAPAAKSRRDPPRAKGIRFPSGFKVSDMLLPESKLQEAMDMAKVYPLLYVLENSMREVIKRVMAAHYGEDWWNLRLSSGKGRTVQDKWSSRTKNERKYHQRRGSHPIDYVDLGDLGTIILSNSAIFFRAVLDCDIDWFRSTFMDDLEQSRNVVGHMNPLDPNNIKDLEVKVERWSKLMKHAGTALNNVRISSSQASASVIPAS